MTAADTDATLAELVRRYDAAVAEGDIESATMDGISDEVGDRQMALERAILATPATDLESLGLKAAFVKRCRAGVLVAGGGDVDAARHETVGDQDSSVVELHAPI